MPESRDFDVPDHRLLFEASPAKQLVLDSRLRIVAVTDRYLRATMTRREEILGRHLFDVFPDNPADPGATGVGNLSASLQRVRESRKPDTMAVQKYDVRRPESEGGGFEERYWSPLNSPVLDSEGRVRWIIHRVEDVTDYVRLTHAMQSGSLATESLMARANEMEAEILRRGQELQYANRELRALHDQLEHRVVERTEELARANAALQREIDARRDTQTALEKAENQLLHSQRLEAVGHLAGGIAHDFNNLLTLILSFTELARQSIPEDSPAIADLDEAMHAARRAAALTHQLLTFSRRQIREVRVFDLREVVSGMQAMVRRLVGEGIECRVDTDRDAEPCLVRADRGQIEQVLMNLVVNARDAMRDGGKLSISLRLIDVDSAFAEQQADVQPGRYAMLAVSDTGCGMDRATQERMFEPFFTTKAPGKGTGLGLSTVYGIVKVSQGTILVYSEIGIGTTFKVLLPASDERVEVSPPQAQVAPVARPGERLLVVEDDDTVRTVLTRILRNANYEVVAARSADEALGLARDPAVEFDLLVTDVIMPGMNGRRLAELVQAMRPETGVLFMSGYTDDVVLQSGVLPTWTAFVHKPLNAASLLVRVREMLERRESRPATD
ncbi:MAG: response regulator [Planctomycetes bacterium]|nr:response regulator [Planctomycetota bacterium]